MNAINHVASACFLTALLPNAEAQLFDKRHKATQNESDKFLLLVEGNFFIADNMNFYHSTKGNESHSTPFSFS